MTQPRKIGTQLVLESWDIPAPAYELLGTDIESTIEELLEKAVATGEAFSQMRVQRDGSTAPFAHRANTHYHAIEIIRYYQQELARLNQTNQNGEPP
jgi:hypothetical protein